MAQTMTGTRMMRARVMMFGIFNAALPGYRPVLAPGGTVRLLST
jgi:hypothetical protein